MQRLSNIILLLVLIPLSLSAKGSDNIKSELSVQKNFADSLFASEDYYAAITEYKRLIYFDSSKTYAYYANFRIGEAYKYGGFFDLAEEFFEKAEASTTDVTEKLAAEMEIVKSEILQRKINEALNRLDALARSGYDEAEINYWRGWAYLFGGSLNLSSEYFRKSQKAEFLTRITSAYSDSLYSVSDVKLMSYIFPGAGQIYLGEYFSGVMSLAWNALWIYVTANAFSDGRIIEGFLVGDLLWLRFYRGNVQNAERLAKEKNVKFVNRLLENLQNNYRGEKP